MPRSRPARPGSRETIETSQPAASRSSAIARPIPLEPPVISAAGMAGEHNVAPTDLRYSARERRAAPARSRPRHEEHRGKVHLHRPTSPARSRASGSRARKPSSRTPRRCGPDLRRARLGRDAHRRRRQHLHRLRRRHRLPRRRALEPRGHGSREGAGRPLPAHRLHDRALRLVRRARRAPARPHADHRAEEGGVLQQRRRGRRERRQDRPARDRTARRHRLRTRLPRAHPDGDVAHLEEAPRTRRASARSRPRSTASRSPTSTARARATPRPRRSTTCARR